ncbi:MAG: DUF3379 family protein [Dehalococcoidia bacterium]
MNCIEFRRVVGADPHAQAPEVPAHAEQCGACARYRDEFLRMDKLIYRALMVEVPSHPARASVRQRWIPRWAAAASVLAAVALSLFIWLSAPREAFAEQLVAHVEGEAQSLVRTTDVVGPERLNDVLARSGVRLKSGAGPVSYAMSCWFRGHYVPHLVVQTDGGPVTVLLLTQEEGVTAREVFDEGGFHGVVLPAPRGAIAVLGRDAQAELVAEQFLRAVEYGP